MALPVTNLFIVCLSASSPTDTIKSPTAGRARWLKPVIPSTLGGRGGWITRSRDRDHPCQHGETPSLLKIQKLYFWWCTPVGPATREVETGRIA